MNVDEVKKAIRGYFIENFNSMTNHFEVRIAEKRSDRYQFMLRHYIQVIEENSCNCFHEASDILREIKASSNLIQNYIINGELPE